MGAICLFLKTVLSQTGKSCRAHLPILISSCRGPICCVLLVHPELAWTCLPSRLSAIVPCGISEIIYTELKKKGDGVVVYLVQYFCLFSARSRELATYFSKCLVSFRFRFKINKNLTPCTSIAVPALQGEELCLMLQSTEITRRKQWAQNATVPRLPTFYAFSSRVK